MYRFPLRLAHVVIMVGFTAAAPQGAGTPTGPGGEAALVMTAAVVAGFSTAAAEHAQAVLYSAAGEQIGDARFTEDGTGGVHVTVHAKGLTPGLHGLHLHAIGTCDGGSATPFSSAGGHYNPHGRKHGHHNPEGFHSGDLPNLEATPGGTARLAVTLRQFSLAELFDGDGTALVVHANQDDQTTDTGPAGPGNSGARVACGVLTR